MSDLVGLEIRDHIAIISMRREAKRNAVDRQLADAIDEALNRLEDEPGLWVGILTGTRMVFSAAATSALAATTRPSVAASTASSAESDASPSSPPSRGTPSAAASRSCLPATWSPPPPMRPSAFRRSPARSCPPAAGTADTQEGVRALLEKRSPVWTGR